MTDTRLIEAAFPLKQVSLDSVHEKNVRHGHISTLHIWPARRPLAASRAVLLATLLRDPGDAESRRALGRRMAGHVEQKYDNRTGRMKDVTVGGVMHWGRESDAAGTAEIAKLREEIREAFGGRAPRVLDPFAGGGAIPLEAMRLGCEVVAADINPVAWFILRCTLHYPQALAGQTRPLPAFALEDRDFVQSYLKAQRITAKAKLREELARLGHRDDAPRQADLPVGDVESPAAQADFAWHLRTWGQRVLAKARGVLAGRYPTYAAFEPVRRKGRKRTLRSPDGPFKPRPDRRLDPDENGAVSTAALNAEFDSLYLENEANPRWVAKPTVAYLWARTVHCGGCRAEIPLLKTRWLCRKNGKRVLLAMATDGGAVAFDIERDVPEAKGGAARRRAHDAEIGAGTMSASGAKCPCCGFIATMQDLRMAGRSRQLGERMTAVVVDGQQGKEYRLPTEVELKAARVAPATLEAIFADIPFGMLSEPTPSEESLGMRIPRYGFDTWRTLFTDRQLLALGTFVGVIRGLAEEMTDYPADWREAVIAYLAASISRVVDRASTLTTWVNDLENICHTFARYALPMVWDFAESSPLNDTTGGFTQAVEWVARVCEHIQAAATDAPLPSVLLQSANDVQPDSVDLICTDPPYYDAIPYSDLMDFFHVWLRRALYDLSPDIDAAFAAPLGPKWNTELGDGELIDDASRFGGDRAASKKNYEDGMARSFERFRNALREDGRLVLVFANKSPDAWETLVSALIRAGFVVDASWPIQTERQNRQRSLTGAALASSIWLVCKKRPNTARPGWDGKVLAEMAANITERLRDFWDAGLRGPDFVWAATGPALEAFSRHPVVRKTDVPGQTLTVTEFLRLVRRVVVGFVVSRLLAQDDGATGELDDPTTYYLLHRNDFGLEPAPVGACILYALSCNLTDAGLAGRLDLLAKGRSSRAGEDEGAEEAKSGNEVRIKRWNQRRGRDLGQASMDGGSPPLIDCIHRVMHLWKAGERSAVDAYLETRGLWHHELFARVVQAIIELAKEDSEERTTLESIQNHVRTQGGVAPAGQLGLKLGEAS